MAGYSNMTASSSNTSNAQNKINIDIPKITTAAAYDQVLTKKTLGDLVKEVDPNEQLDEDVEELLLNYAEEYMNELIESSCKIARHRNSTVLEVKDVQTHLERDCNVWIPGFGTDELRPYKRAPVTEAHKQRMALIKKTVKKY